MSVALLVYTTPVVVEHKVAAGFTHFWAFKRRPRRISEVVRIYLAAKGRIVAWARAAEDELDELDDYGDYEGFAACVAWNGDEAHRLTNGPEVKPFRGFRYLEPDLWPGEDS